MKALVGLLVIAAGVLIGWFILGQNKQTVSQLLRTGTNSQITPTVTPFGTPTGTANTGNTVPPEAGAGKGGVAERTVVTYTDSGFAPQTVAVKVGTTVAFMNESSIGMWVISVTDSTHQQLPGFDQQRNVSKGGSYEYTFTKTGSWKYSNQTKSSDTAQVVVSQ